MAVSVESRVLVDKELLDEVVRQSLARELERRRELRPHVQLGVHLGADRGKVCAAFERLRTQYLPEKYARHGVVAQELAAQILALLERAQAQLCKPATVVEPSAKTRPRTDETLRAIETLRRSVERRFAEGLALRDAGRLSEALRAFESVLALDRHHVPALDELRALRARLEPRLRPSVLASLVSRLRRPRSA
jgi:hypothetical protein